MVSSMTSDNPQFAAIGSSPTVAAGASASVTVRFTPTVATAQTGTLTIASNDPAAATVKVQMTGTGAAAPSSTSEVTLQVDGGSYNIALGFPNGADKAYFVNRLTPPKYPATLKSVQIYFANRTNGLKAGAPIQIVMGAFGGALTLAPTTVLGLGTFSNYNVPPITITSGDFVVGFMTQNPAGILPADLDQISPSQKRSYFSLDGVTYTPLDNSAATAGNLAIRAVVTLGQ